jgi:tripartite ATP-independent transporter DctP family solute receptor
LKRGKNMFKNGKALIVILAGALVFGSLLAACGSTKPAASDKSTAATATKSDGKKYTFRLADIQPADYPTTLGDKKFAELVKQKTDGRIQIDVFPAAQLGDEKSVIEQVQLGAIEFTRISSGPLAEFNKAFGVFSLPYIFDNNDHMWKFLNGAGAKLLDDLDTSKMKGLAYYTSGSRNFYAKKPLKKLADLKGMKIRVQQNQINIDLISALGASATPMAYGEVYSGLQTGILDAAENNIPSYASAKHFETAKYFIEDGHQRVPEVLMMSLQAFNKLSDDDKKIIKQAALDSVATQREEWDKYETKSREQVLAAGSTITKVDNIKEWQDAVKPVIDKYRTDYKDILDQIDKSR